MSVGIGVEAVKNSSGSQPIWQDTPFAFPAGALSVLPGLSDAGTLVFLKFASRSRHDNTAFLRGGHTNQNEVEARQIVTEKLDRVRLTADENTFCREISGSTRTGVGNIGTLFCKHPMKFGPLEVLLISDESVVKQFLNDRRAASTEMSMEKGESATDGARHCSGDDGFATAGLTSEQGAQ